MLRTDLHGILRSVVVAEDPLRDREEPVAVLAREDAERILVAVPGSLNEVAIHLPPSCTNANWHITPH
ncbi:MAG: hypothetical protein E6J47_07820 [Chloroflexi bacterium]|nr:MAG: hypothetical protein E6J47_07820 [Chloroflexota bacterium]